MAYSYRAMHASVDQCEFNRASAGRGKRNRKRTLCSNYVSHEKLMNGAKLFAYGFRFYWNFMSLLVLVLS